MRVLVDTSAWVEYLRGTGSVHNRWLHAALQQGTDLAWTDPVLFELTAGAASPERATRLRALLLRGTPLPIAGLRDWEDAAVLYRTARSRGRTVRSTVDCLIATVALRTGTPVLARDRDYELLAQVTDLTLVTP